MKICWSAIVKNEAARIERAMHSLIDHVDCAVIYDTGSTDDTDTIIGRFFAEHGKPCALYKGDFINFEHARNRSLQCANESGLDWDYLLLMDADMELRVSEFPHLEAACYQMVQKAGGLEYYNARLLKKGIDAKYVGVTHEFLSVPGNIERMQPEQAYFIDHADGANRPEKFARDIKLLKEGLEKEPNNERYWFYLGQSYKDAGMPREAVDCYKKRVQLGGWDEEVWQAQMHVGSCMKHYDEPGFVSNTLEAYEKRPQRAESLYVLANHYRLQGKNKLASLFSRQAMQIPRPDDLLFVNEFAYSVGAKVEFSIAGFYDPKTRADAFSACDSVAVGKHPYHSSRDEARANLFHYLPRAKDVMPSFVPCRLYNTLGKGWSALNPSIARKGDRIYCVLRTVNYVITPSGQYDIDGLGSAISADNPIRTRNYMMELGRDLVVKASVEMQVPSVDDFPLVKGWEDMRLFCINGVLYVSATVREANAGGLCEQWLGEWDGKKIVNEKRLLSLQDHEKNWMPIIGSGHPRWIHSIGKIIDEKGNVRPTNGIDIETSSLRGSSQVVPYRSGYLAIVHEANVADGKRYYWHRFVFLDFDLNVRKLSLPFVFEDKQIEFCAGMCFHPDNRHLLISYGVRDEEAVIAKVNADDVAEFLFA